MKSILVAWHAMDIDMMQDDNPATILIVEDDDIDFIGVQRALKELKVANPTIRAKDGIEALSLLRGTDGQTKIEPPYIILLDLNMPRMNGIEFLDVVREDEVLKPSIVFVLTTSDDDRDIVASYRRNVEGYIVKSDAKESLNEALSSLKAYQWSILMLPKESSQKVA